MSAGLLASGHSLFGSHGAVEGRLNLTDGALVEDSREGAFSPVAPFWSLSRAQVDGDVGLGA